MFTGLIREVGTIIAVGHRRGVLVVTIAAPATSSGLALGDSLAVDGICLTVAALAGPRVTVDASPETRRVTTLDRWRVGRRVHLEPALAAGEALGGHFVLGHVDGTGRVVRLARSAGVATLTVSAPGPLCRQMLPKGSIAVDGVSLTLDEGPFDGRFTVALVPHTLASTRLSAARAGDAVNLEIDVLAKAARQYGQAGHAAGLSRRSPQGEADLSRRSPQGEGGRLTVKDILARGWR